MKRIACFRLEKLLIAGVILFSAALPQTLSGQGLRFNGLERQIDERTSYRVFDRKRPAFNGDLSIKFKLQTYMDAEAGLIFRLQDSKRPEIPALILFYDGATDRHRFYVNIEKQRTAISLSFKKPHGGRTSGWMNVEFRLLTEDGMAMLSVDSDTVYASINQTGRHILPDLVFGKNDYNIDIPSFSIRELSVGNKMEEYRFPLDEETGTLVSEDGGKVFGSVVNPVWLAGDHHRWIKDFSRTSSQFLCAGYDDNTHEIRTFDKDSITYYNVLDGTVRRKAFANECPVSITIGTNFLDGKNGRIIAYEVNYDKSWKGPVTVAALDTLTLTWTTLSTDQMEMQMHHHSEWLDADSGQFYIYGGFGNGRYNGEFRRMNVRTGQWETCPELTGDALWPRYFCAMGYSKFDGSLYIYGGMGNESGRQIVGREYFYDLYQVDPVTFEVRKKWALDSWEGPNCVAARNMAICEEDGFYALCYPESVTESSLQLYRFAMKDGKHVKLGSTIPIFSDKITTNANLFYDRELGKMIALVEESKDDISSSVTAYTISYPPKAPIIEETPVQMNTLLWFIFASAALVSVTIVILAILYLRSRKYRSFEMMDYERHGARIRPVKECPDSIFLFGDTMLLSSSGEDITAMMTERLKEAFLLILYYTAEGGISSRRLSGMMWPDKEEETSKNVRGVTLNNLRKILAKINGIHLIFKEKRYSIECTGPIFCDYVECLKELECYSPGNDRLLSILARGKFLRDEKNILLDRMKEDMENKIVPAVTSEAGWRFGNEDWGNALLCTDILFEIDPFNENALAVCVRTLCKIGRSDEARVRYNNFITQYKKDYDEDYPVSFENVLGQVQ